MSLDVLEELKKFKIADIAIWLKEILYFIFTPTKFSASFFSKNIVQQIEQIIFYSLLNILINYITGSEKSGHMLGKGLLVVFLSSIPFLIINFLSFFILKRSISLWKIFLFVIITQLIFYDALYIVGYIYFQNENFLLIFALNCFLLASFLFNLFVIWYSLTNSILKSTIGSIVNILILNITLLLFGLTAFDSYSTANSSKNSLTDEFTNCVDKVNYRGVVTEVKSITDIKNTDSIHLLSYKHNDSTIKIQFDNFKEILEFDKKNIKIIDSLIPNLQYNRNKEIFIHLNNYYKDSYNYFRRYPNKKDLVEVTNYKDSQSEKVIAFSKIYKINKNVSINFNKFKEAMEELRHADEVSRYPLKLIEFFLTPMNYIEDRYFIETGKSVHIRI